MYLKYAEIGESEKSLGIVDMMVKKHIRNKAMFSIVDDIQTQYHQKGEKGYQVLKSYSERFDAIEDIYENMDVDMDLLRELRPILLELAEEYVRIIEGTTREGRKKHLSVV
ncbi:hypothetical protein COK07_29305 [Bacillus thuringiensis]|uniref:hypothetical protein n=1 Tax=Bacillus thuringiensis TaxID=1428 RepID=UPI0006A8001C|nr:hypothetical protein [Bacillus thuringiensis]PEF03588.1 hypothetical protein COM97_26645 [Bacillus thuringiensis]PFI26675.1 hypothetical protein COI53_26730 [Bacillus thuringiensis]PFP70050.1 hypothetical protein COK07_29305 [Bacillus thuringiensis]CUB09151.1 hypothetical protein BN2127_JRS1_00935 [Bacillus cereus]